MISADTARDEHGVADQHKANRYTVARLGWTVIYKITGNHRSASKRDVVREDFEQLPGSSALVTYRRGLHSNPAP